MAAIPGDVDLTGCSLERSEDLEHPAGKLRNGKETAFREFVERYQARIYHVALAILGTPEQADEIARKAFVDAHRAFNGITSDSSLFIRTHRITVDECYRFLAGSWFVPLRSHRGAERRNLLNKLLVRIPREDRHILLLCEMEGYSTANISQLFGLNEDAVRTILFRTRQRLADALRREGGKRRRLLRLAGLLALLAASIAAGRAVESHPWHQSMACEVTPEQPYLGFDLRFHDEYVVAVPAKIFEHAAGLLQARVRVKPEDGSAETVILSRALAIPEYARGKIMLADGFDLGPGRYRVDLQMGDGNAWECSAHWGIRTQAKDGLPGLPLTPNQIRS